MTVFETLKLPKVDILLPLRFYVKSILKNLEVKTAVFLQFLKAEIY